jgi:hypothetical protein
VGRQGQTNKKYLLKISPSILTIMLPLSWPKASKNASWDNLQLQIELSSWKLQLSWTFTYGWCSNGISLSKRKLPSAEQRTSRSSFDDRSAIVTHAWLWRPQRTSIKFPVMMSHIWKWTWKHWGHAILVTNNV